MKEFCLPPIQYGQIGVMMANGLTYPLENEELARHLGNDEEIVLLTDGECEFLAAAKRFNAPWLTSSAPPSASNLNVLVTPRVPLRLWLRKG